MTVHLIDISLPLYTNMPVYPGTLETKITTTSNSTGTSISSEILIGSHAGTHIDAPYHASSNPETINQVDLERFFGPCRVLDLTNSLEAITVKDLEKKNIQKHERILIKTKNSIRGFIEFYDDYIYLDGDAAEWLVKKEPLLVGIDALSIKQRGSKDLRPHTAILGGGISVIEGLDLSKTLEGNYTLSAFPLKFIGIDGSPTRAVLITE